MSGASQGRRQNQRLQRRVLVVALLLVGLLASLNGLLNPLFEPPDELLHYEFVRQLVDQKRLPIQEQEGDISQSHQPPLYYVVGALLVSGINDPQTSPQRNPFWAYYAAGEVSQDNKLQFLNLEEFGFPYQGTALVVHVLRLWSTLLALGTVVATWLLGQALWPNNPARVALMLAIGTLNPMFLYIAGAANNDSLVVLWGAVLLWLVVRGMQDGFRRRTTIWIGLVWGVALLSKLNGLMLLAAWVPALVWVARQRQETRLFLSRAGLISAIALAAAGWWFGRNVLIYGDPLALQVILDVWGERSSEQRALAVLWPDLKYSWTNFWGRFGYGQVPLPGPIYAFFLVLSSAAAAGGVKWLLSSYRLRRPRRGVWFMMGLTILAYASALLYYILRNPTGANGRYVFPALPAIAAVMAASLCTWTTHTKKRTEVCYGLTAILAGIAIFSTAAFLPWTYARPRLLSQAEATEQIERPADALWGERIALLGTGSSAREVTAGDRVSLTACWQAKATMEKNYTLSVRLLDPHFTPLGQRDTYPGLGRFPTSFWRPGEIFCDDYPIQVTEELTLPVAATIDLGFYNLDTGEVLPAVTGGGDPVERVRVEEIKVSPKAAPEVPEPEHVVSAEFAQGVALVGYSWSAETAEVGEVIAVELIWAASGALDRSYTIFAHLRDEDGEMIAQDDGLPRDGVYPTTFWGEGDKIVDRHRFLLPPDLVPGRTTLQVGLYHLESLERLPRVPDAEHPDLVALNGPLLVEGR